MIKRLVIFLIRKKLGLKLYQPFIFDDQAEDAEYVFTEWELLKDDGYIIQASEVSLNKLLSDECGIVKIE
jgi:hypothetical protein